MKRPIRIFLVLILAVVIFGLFIYLWGPTCAVPEVVQEDRCRHGHHAVLLAGAIQQYCQRHGGPPPAVLVGPNGHHHSWRVLILPYLPGGAEAYREYRFDEPWDSDHNRQALEWFLRHGFHYCPQDRLAAQDPLHRFTSYTMLVRGEDASFGHSQKVTLEKVIIIESAECGIQFAEPRDLMWEDLWTGDSVWGVGKLYSRHNFAWAIYGNGRFCAIPMNIVQGHLRLILEGYLVLGGAGPVRVVH